MVGIEKRKAEVWTSLPVLLIDGERNSRGMRGEPPVETMRFRA